MKRSGLLIGIGVVIAVLVGVGVIVRWAAEQDAETADAPIDVDDDQVGPDDTVAPGGDDGGGDGGDGGDGGPDDAATTSTSADDPFGITDGHSRGRLVVVAESVDSVVNARLEPGGEVAGSFRAGEQVTTTGRRATVDGVEWVEVNIGGENPLRWVAAEFLAADDEIADDGDPVITDDFPTGTYVVVTEDEGGVVNARNGPGGDVIGSYTDGDGGLEATGRRSVVGGIEWAEFETDDRLALVWIAVQFVEPAAAVDEGPTETSTTEG